MKTIEITKGMNGYPEGLYQTEIFETVEEMKTAINNGENDFSIYRQKNGWDFWEYVGFATKPFNMQDELVQDMKNIIVVDKDYDVDDIKEVIEDNYPECEHDDEDEKAERIKWIENLAKNIHEEMNEYINRYGIIYEIFEVENSDENPIDMWEKETVRYSDDVWTLAIGK